MSEFINNSLKRQEDLKDIINQIHQGLPLVKAKALFKSKFETVSTEEITQLEQSLIADGMPISEVQGLCDVHAAVFDGSISDIHAPKTVSETLGHPVQVFLEENKRIITLIETEIEPYLNNFSDTSRLMLQLGLERLTEVSVHYSRKENLFFPILEKKGNEAIPKVMWGIDNEIRQGIKANISNLYNKDLSTKEALSGIPNLLEKVVDMVTKENNILIPMLVKEFTIYNWILIDQESDELGYFLDTPKYDWKTQKLVVDKEEKPAIEGNIDFDAGTLSQIEANAIFNTVPFDMTYVDKDGLVKYFTQGKDRIFDRPLTIIGRHVNMCHPPQSVHIVEEIVESFKTGQKEHEDFWIQMGPKFIHIRYFAVRDKEGNFLGTLEVSQDIKPIRDLDGEKRLIG
jgi:hypothetical protein